MGYIPTDTNKTYITYKLNFQNTNTECPNLGHPVLTLEVVALVLFTLIVALASQSRILHTPGGPSA